MSLYRVFANNLHHVSYARKRLAVSSSKLAARQMRKNHLWNDEFSKAAICSIQLCMWGGGRQGLVLGSLCALDVCRLQQAHILKKESAACHSCRRVLMLPPQGAQSCSCWKEDGKAASQQSCRTRTSRKCVCPTQTRSCRTSTWGAPSSSCLVKCLACPASKQPVNVGFPL